MGNQGVFEPGEAVREGWARDQEDELSIDGYNAFIQISTNDGTTGLRVVNSSGGVAFLSKSDGDGYVARNLGIGTESPTEKLDVRGVAKVYELQVTTGATSGYVLTSDAEGVATWLPPAAATELILDGYVRDETFQENKTAQEEINDTIIASLDGYASASGSDGYIAFFTGSNTLAGDNDLFFDRVNNQLQVSSFKLTTDPTDGYTLTSDSSGNATWQENPGSPQRHRDLDQLVHNIAETSYEEYTYSGQKVTNLTVWTSTEKVTKIREEQFTYTGNNATTIVTIQYDALGIATETLTENINYSGNRATDIIRTLT
jgi:hypothetical protein